MAASKTPREAGSSPLSSEPPETTNYTKPPQNAREEAKERRKRAAAKALAEQSRLRSESSRQLTSFVNKTTKFPLNSQESRNISPVKSSHISGSGFITLPVNSIGTHTILSSTSGLDIPPTIFHDVKNPVQETSINNNPSSQPLHTDRFTDKTEPIGATQLAMAVSPKKFSPTNWAKRDTRFEVQFLVMKDETIKCTGPGYMSKPIFLEWDGIDREALKVVNGDKECLFIEFYTIQRVSYNPTGQHIQLIFKAAAQEEQLQTVVIAMNTLPTEEWVQLQQLFRQVERKWGIRCDQEDMSFFDASIKSITKKPYQKMETPYLNRPDATSQRAAEKLPKAPRRSSVPSASRRQSVGPNLGITSKITKTPKNKAERPKAHLSVEVKNIIAAKVIDQPLRIPRLSTPSKSPSVTSSLMSRASQSPLKEGIGSQRRTSRGYGDRDSPTKRCIRSQNRGRFAQAPETPERALSPYGLSSLFGSDDSEHEFSNLEQPDRTPSQRFIDQINKAKMISSSQPNESPKTSLDLFAQSSVSIVRDRSTQEPGKPEGGFEAFIRSIQGPSQVEDDLVSSPSHIRQKRSRSPSPPKLPQPLSLTPVNLVTKLSQNAYRILESDRPLKKLKESHAATENETQLYYQCKSGQDFLLPVAVDDQVIRLRTKNEMEESGKQSKYDLFDGPWLVLAISETSFPLSSDFFVLESEDSDSAASRQAKWDKMLTTKIRLKFPEGSMADPWVEISRLLPAINPSSIMTGTPIPSSLEVATHSSYLELVDRLRVQPLAPGSHNSFVKKSSSDAVNDEMYAVEIRKGKFAVFIIIDHNGVSPDLYEVAKIRQKRLRLYTKTKARQVEATQYDDDKWVKRLLTQHGDIAQNKIVVDEYLCSWAGWAVEDQTWVPRGNFGDDALLRLFDEENDSFRNVPDNIVLPVDDLVYKDDLKKARAALKKGKRNSSGSNGQSSAASLENRIRSGEWQGESRDEMQYLCQSRSTYRAKIQVAVRSLRCESLDSSEG
ncbi:hypothetical protein V496_00191 [Pseudogymnoascus sp. VKM F-4515 (FW-2607)]|nr:hypothetical protein V496_00191 [Pseudogymnoascus sp. VKM F-4515 (FW-2607)]